MEIVSLRDDFPFEFLFFLKMEIKSSFEKTILIKKKNYSFTFFPK